MKFWLKAPYATIQIHIQETTIELDVLKRYFANLNRLGFVITTMAFQFYVQ